MKVESLNRMAARTRWIALGLGLASVGCERDAEPPAATVDNPASCEAMVDHRNTACPLSASRLFDINLCEQDRVEVAPMGCSQALADYVLCQSQAEIDCETGEAIGCDDHLMSLRQCKQSFTQRTSCSRQQTRDLDDCGGAAGRFSFSCIDLSTFGPPAVPSHCDLIHDPGIFCCDSFANDTLSESIFLDPVLGPDELPPDNSGIDFSDATMCLDFSDVQGWGRCDTSSGCACASCAVELTACAGNYGCLISHRCDRGGSCSPDNDPFFTGWGDTDALVACMEAAGCAPNCN